jgi:Ca2+/Na+ antiporter
MESSRSLKLSPAVVMFTVLAIGAAILIALALMGLRDTRPSTGVAIAVAFAWGLISMIVTGTYAIATGRRVGMQFAVRKGTTTVRADPLGQDNTGVELSGPGVEAAGEENVAITNKVPAVLLVLSSIALVFFLLWLWRSGWATGYGTLVSQFMPFYMLNWARNAWPRSDR